MAGQHWIGVAMSMIRFLARRQATCTDLLTCLYDLKPAESEIFYELVRKGPCSLDQLSMSVKRERTTVYRCLQRLTVAGLTYREVQGRQGRGYIHLYAAADLATIKEASRVRVSELCKSLGRLVDTFESDVMSKVNSTKAGQ